MAELCKRILHTMAVCEPEAGLILTAARIHDIGKVAIPGALLVKAAPLTSDEWALIESHPGRGADLLACYSKFGRAAAMVRHHHERWDGSGYPDGLRGPEIPFGARVIAVADSFDAMTHHRPYRQAKSISDAVSILLEGCGTQWDPMIVDALLENVLERLV